MLEKLARHCTVNGLQDSVVDRIAEGVEVGLSDGGDVCGAENDRFWDEVWEYVEVILGVSEVEGFLDGGEYLAEERGGESHY